MTKVMCKLTQSNFAQMQQCALGILSNLVRKSNQARRLITEKGCLLRQQMDILVNCSQKVHCESLNLLEGYFRSEEIPALKVALVRDPDVPAHLPRSSR